MLRFSLALLVAVGFEWQFVNQACSEMTLRVIASSVSEEEISSFPLNLTHLELERCSSSTLAGISGFKKLSELVLDNCSIDAETIRLLYGIPTLRRLEILGNETSLEIPLSPPYDECELTELIVEKFKGSLANFVPRSVEELGVHYVNAPAKQDLEFIATLQSIRTLNLSVPPSNHSLLDATLLKPLDLLETLRLKDLVPTGLEDLPALKRLELVSSFIDSDQKNLPFLESSLVACPKKLFTHPMAHEMVVSVGKSSVDYGVCLTEASPTSYREFVREQLVSKWSSSDDLSLRVRWLNPAIISTRERFDREFVTAVLHSQKLVSLVLENPEIDYRELVVSPMPDSKLVGLYTSSGSDQGGMRHFVESVCRERNLRVLALKDFDELPVVDNTSKAFQKIEKLWLYRCNVDLQRLASLIGGNTSEIRFEECSIGPGALELTQNIPSLTTFSILRCDCLKDGIPIALKSAFFPVTELGFEGLVFQVIPTSNQDRDIAFRSVSFGKTLRSRYLRQLHSMVDFVEQIR